jgi:DNA-binding transcriptional regulator YdaS (Cro superfamily)
MKPNVSLKIALLLSRVRTQVRLSSVTAIREERISRIVNGWVRPTPEEANAIARAIGADAITLFSRAPTDALTLYQAAGQQEAVTRVEQGGAWEKPRGRKRQ